MALGKSEPSSLDQARRRIDEIDTGLHDLLMDRATMVDVVAGLKRGDRTAPFRPGREARILRRLVGRHHGNFPRAVLVRLWRELLSGSVAMQAQLPIAVCDGCWDLARDHFGSHAPLFAAPEPDEVIEAVAEGRAAMAVLPLFDDDPAPWWLMLAERQEAPKIVVRLPFGARGNGADLAEDAFVLAAMEPEPSGDDCTLLVVTAAAPLPPSRIADAFLAERLDCNPLAQSGNAQLVEIDALVAPDDAKIARALKQLGARATWLGAYARPLPDASLGGVAPE